GGAAQKPPAWWPSTPNGTWNAVCDRCGWWNAHEPRGRLRPATTATTPLRRPPAVDAAGAGATARGDCEGRQRPVGHCSRTDPQRGARRGRGGAAGRGGRSHRTGYQPRERLCLLHRELETLTRRSAVPDGLQP